MKTDFAKERFLYVPKDIAKRQAKKPMCKCGRHRQAVGFGVCTLCWMKLHLD